MARLYAKCSVPFSHIKGKLGWSLTYQDPLEKHYERFSYTNQNNISKADLVVYSSTDQIPGNSTHLNISQSASFKYVNSSQGFSNSTQSCLALLANVNSIDTRLDAIYNNSLNENKSNGSNDSSNYITGVSTTYNANLTRNKNRQSSIVANNSKKIAIGNDSDIYGVCFFERDGLFPPGIYVLTVQRFSPDSSIPLKTNRNVWAIKAAQKELTCGTYLDLYSEINLT